MNFHDLIDHMYGRIQGRGPGEKQKKILKYKTPSIVETIPLVEPTFNKTEEEINEILHNPPTETFGFKKNIVEKEKEYNRWVDFVNDEKEEIEKTEKKIKEEEKAEDDIKKKKKLLSLKKKLEDAKEELEDTRQTRKEKKKEYLKYVEDVKPLKKQVKSLVGDLLKKSVVNVDIKIKEDKEKARIRAEKEEKKRTEALLKRQDFFERNRKYIEDPMASVRLIYNKVGKEWVFDLDKFKSLLAKYRKLYNCGNGIAFEHLLENELVGLVILLTGCKGYVMSNSDNPKIADNIAFIGGIKFNLRDLAVFDLDQEADDDGNIGSAIEAKCYIKTQTEDGIDSDGTEIKDGKLLKGPYIQEVKIEGNKGFVPYYIPVGDELLLYNVWYEGGGNVGWVNSQNFKRTFMIYALNDGIFFIDPTDITDRKIRDKHGMRGEQLSSLIPEKGKKYLKKIKNKGKTDTENVLPIEGKIENIKKVFSKDKKK